MATCISGKRATSWKERIGEVMWMNLNKEGWEPVVVREELATGIKVVIAKTIKNPHTQRGKFVCALTD